MIRFNKLTPVLALIIGMAFVVIMVKLKQPPERGQTQAEAIPVRILLIKPQSFPVEVRGFGQVMPANSWNAVANVGGRIVWKHPKLASGNLIPKGTRLLEIDPSRYQLAVASVRADLAGIQAELKLLEQEARNTGALLALEEQRLALARQELERVRVLTERQALPETRYDEQQRATLQQQQAAQSLQNQLDLMPARRDALHARRARMESALASAQKDLNDTRFTAPWDLRVHQVGVDRDQHVNPGQALFSADDIALAEATVQLEIAPLRRVLSQLSGMPDQLGHAQIDALADFHKSLPLDELTIKVFPTNAPDAVWPGTLARVTSSLDPATRTIQAVISVEEPYRNAHPPARPPLVRNMFVQARIMAPAAQPVIAVPASAVHQGYVYLADDNDRLLRREVSVAWQQGDLAIINAGLKPGHRLILDDLVPAIDGVLLAPQPAEATEAFPAQPGTGDAS